MWTFHQEFSNPEISNWPHYTDSSDQYLLIHRHEFYKDFLLMDKERNMSRFTLKDIWHDNDFDDWLDYADYLIENDLLVPEAQALALWPTEEWHYELPGRFHRIEG